MRTRTKFPLIEMKHVMWAVHGRRENISHVDKFRFDRELFDSDYEEMSSYLKGLAATIYGISIADDSDDSDPDKGAIDTAQLTERELDFMKCSSIASISTFAVLDATLQDDPIFGSRPRAVPAPSSEILAEVFSSLGSDGVSPIQFVLNRITSLKEEQPNLINYLLEMLQTMYSETMLLGCNSFETFEEIVDENLEVREDVRNAVYVTLFPLLVYDIFEKAYIEECKQDLDSIISN